MQRFLPKTAAPSTAAPACSPAARPAANIMTMSPCACRPGSTTRTEPGDRLVVMHGMSSRVLRGLLTGAPVHPGFAAPIAAGIRQGALVEIAEGREIVLDQGDAFEPV